jgi:hypothetical protein
MEPCQILFVQPSRQTKFEHRQLRGLITEQCPQLGLVVALHHTNRVASSFFERVTYRY